VGFAPPKAVSFGQTNIIIPLRLAGRGDVDLSFTVDRIQANTVTINIK
jgi:hypothetical protein